MDDINIASTIGLTTNNSIPVISVFPNPGNGQVKIGLKGIESKRIELSVTDLLGQELHKETVEVNDNFIDLNLNVKAGVYFIKILETGTNRKAIKKIIIQK